MSWSWHTGTTRWKDRCVHCSKSLREDYAAGIVKWTDGQLYHVACLLDKKAANAPDEAPGSGVVGFYPLFTP